ncbi:hypothetical protein AOLI_G00192320 [Acnodon oligacanthus]
MSPERKHSREHNFTSYSDCTYFHSQSCYNWACSKHCNRSILNNSHKSTHFLYCNNTNYSSFYWWCYFWQHCHCNNLSSDNSFSKRFHTHCCCCCINITNTDNFRYDISSKQCYHDNCNFSSCVRHNTHLFSYK